MGYPLLTRRLWIDPLTLGDLDAFLAYRRDPAVARFQSWEPSYSETDARRLIAEQPVGQVLPEPGGWIQLAVRDRRDKSLFGDVAIHTLHPSGSYEIGVTLAAAAQGRGIASESLTAVLSHLFGPWSAHRVVATCEPRNDAAVRLLRRVGMRYESRQVDAERGEDEWLSLDGYAILAREHRP